MVFVIEKMSSLLGNANKQCHYCCCNRYTYTKPEFGAIAMLLI